MFSPKLYRVNKVPLKFILKSELDVEIENEENNIYSVRQQDNPLFRQIRLVTNDESTYIPHIIFVDAKGANANKDGLAKVVTEGFYFNNRHYSISERSASMVRQSMLSFIDSRLINVINDIVTMGLTINKTVLSKWSAYRGLMLSSCHCLEGWKPKIVIVPDCYATIKNQHIKYVVDKEIEFVDKEGLQRTWKQKDIAEGVRDIEINLFDGCGICHPAVIDELSEWLSDLGDMKGGASYVGINPCPFYQRHGT